ncbi:MAG: hypothetical protein AAFO69_06350 [Bacteroidota bacterium]
MKFKSFKYYNKPWVLYLLLLAATVLWLFICYVGMGLWLDIHSPFQFFVVFVVGEFLLTISLAKLRFRNNGHLIIDHSGIQLVGEINRHWDYTAIQSATIYYYYENFWIGQWGRLGGFLRYHNLKFIHKRSKQSLDKVVINGKTVYLKIRSRPEAEKLEKAIDFLYPRLEHFQVYSTTTEALSATDDGKVWTLKVQKPSKP